NPNDTQFNNQWGPKKIRCPEAWDQYKGNGSYFTAVLDTGVMKTHADLNDHIVPGYDFWQNDNDPQDNYGHGTHRDHCHLAVQHPRFELIDGEPGDAGRAVSCVGLQRDLPALPGSRFDADRLEHEREQPGGHLLAGGHHRVVFASVVIG